MVYLEAIIITIICINLAFSLWQTRLLALVIKNTASKLDSSLAQSLQSIVSELPIGDFEPPHPKQQLITQVLQDKMAPPIVAKEVSRDEAGKFS